MIIKNLCILVLWKIVALALHGLNAMILSSDLLLDFPSVEYYKYFILLTVLSTDLILSGDSSNSIG